ncbi:hypothetical protein FRX31_031461 [Thalictrum thalictroides]|uniref:Uncharacterized protein n=1 Tax=Thalictrum thalictroides TaxID=46969 RepID=A0A7J6V1U2_THATH|nr:hypothetical protein FRX31_031461 [Thalictrum thalictroides]
MSKLKKGSVNDHWCVDDMEAHGTYIPDKHVNFPRPSSLTTDLYGLKTNRNLGRPVHFLVTKRTKACGWIKS